MATDVIPESKSVTSTNKPRKAIRDDITWRVFGCLTVTGRTDDWVYPSGEVTPVWDCLCECGKTLPVLGKSLKSGNTKSCGCLKIKLAFLRVGENCPNFIHGKSKTPEYISWHQMIKRTSDPEYPQYEDYGGRGILVCQRWRENFEHFLEDMGERPPGMTIDRIDNNLGYEKSNCRWATKTQQSRNRRSNRPITIGDRSMTGPEWQEISGINHRLIRSRMSRGWSVEDAVFREVKKI